MGHPLRRLVFLGLVGMLGLVASLTSAQALSPGPVTAAAPAAKHILSYVTLYGFVDNSPPGTDIAYPQIHKGAAGTGTFADPVTFATDKGEFKPGTIVYYSFLKKYFIMEDGCTECTKDWKGGGNGDNPTPRVKGRQFRIDLWAGGNKSSLKGAGKKALLKCGDDLTQPNGGDILVNAPSGLPVNATPIFNPSTLRCQKPG
jgi:hypothetical protein